ncbi:MAG: CheR family methyltransferase [Myxococcota bacterium]
MISGVKEQQGAALSDRDFGRLADLIHSTLGIKMPVSKKIMLQSRLLRRMRALGIDTYEAYCEHVLSPEGEASELTHLLDVATTNKTSFFRESDHFDYLMQQALPRLVALPELRASRKLELWSAACSTGQEPYTLAMVVAYFFETHHLSDWTFSVLGTDISTKVLQAAKLGIYAEGDATPIPPAFRTRFLARGRGSQRGTIRMLPGIRARVRFERANLMAPLPRTAAQMHVIFCRNALIYFDQAHQTAIVNNLRQRLWPQGFLMLGMSESIHGYGLPLTPVGRSIYQHPSTGQEGSR